MTAELKIVRIEAALDVFEEEPLSRNSELWGLEDFTLMPHRARPTPPRQVDFGNLAVENVGNFVKGNEVMNIMTLEKYNPIT